MKRTWLLDALEPIVRFAVGPLEIAKQSHGLVERRGIPTADAAPAVCFGQQQHIEEVGMEFEPLSRPVAECSIGVGPCRGKVFDQPAGAGRDEVADRLAAGSDGVPPIDRQADVVDKRGGEQFLIEGPLAENEAEHLEPGALAERPRKRGLTCTTRPDDRHLLW